VNCKSWLRNSQFSDFNKKNFQLFLSNSINFFISKLLLLNINAQGNAKILGFCNFMNIFQNFNNLWHNNNSFNNFFQNLRYFNNSFDCCVYRYFSFLYSVNELNFFFNMIDHIIGFNHFFNFSDFFSNSVNWLFFDFSNCYLNDFLFNYRSSNSNFLFIVDWHYFLDKSINNFIYFN